jgi:deazaflavin-dependent oxidoreductase (nitroreductase family)
VDVGAKFLGTRWAVRAPIALFKAHLGFLFAGRMLLLLHRGRNSGAERSVVLETVDREDPDTVLVASGFGTTSQWYQNLKAEPSCLVSIGFRNRVPATAELLDTSASSSLLARYAADHPRLWKHLSRSITTLTGDEKLDIPIVRLHLERRAN